MATSGNNQDDSAIPGSETKDKICQLCEKKGKKNDTIGYCKDCMKYLCENCHSSHIHAKHTKHHTLFDWKSRTKSFKLTKPKSRIEDVCTISCDKHRDKVIDYICLVHNAVGCSVCMAMGHMNCEIKFIPQVAASLEDTDDYKDILKEMIAMVQKSQILVNEVNNAKIESERYRIRITQDVRKFHQQLHEAMAELENGLFEQTEKAKQEDYAKLDACIKKYETVCQDVEKLMAALQVLRSNKQKCQLFVTMKLTKTSMEPLQQILRHPEEPKCMQYQFQPEWETLEVMQNEDALGKVVKRIDTDILLSASNVKDKIMVFESTRRNSDAAPRSRYMSMNGSTVTDACDMPLDEIDSFSLNESNVVENGPTSPFLEDLEAENGNDVSSLRDAEELETNEAADICVLSKSDCYPVCVSSSVLLHDNNLVVIDTANWKLKLLDTQRNRLIQELSEIGSPWDGTNISDDEVAVTFPVLKRIMLFKYELNFSTNSRRITRNSLTKLRELKVRGHCYGIAYTSDKMIVTCAPGWLLGEGPTKVEILNMQGNVLQRIMSDDEGEKLFIDPRYVAVSDDARTLFISNWGDNTVTSLIIETSDVSTYADDKLQKPGKIIIDSFGSLYICGQNSNNVHRIMPDGTGLQVMLSGNGLVAPRSISVSEGQGTIYVGMIGSEFIRTYHIL